MKTSIFKYTLEDVTTQHIMVPYHAKLLKVAEQHGKLCLWAEVSPESIYDILSIKIVGTGQVSEEDVWWYYLDTVVMSNGFVWHVYYYDTGNEWSRG